MIKIISLILLLFLISCTNNNEVIEIIEPITDEEKIILDQDKLDNIEYTMKEKDMIGLDKIEKNTFKNDMNNLDILEKRKIQEDMLKLSEQEKIKE
jgi:hypothetical protein